jgi:hypothetical protein
MRQVHKKWCARAVIGIRFMSTELVQSVHIYMRREAYSLNIQISIELWNFKSSLTSELRSALLTATHVYSAKLLSAIKI